MATLLFGAGDHVPEMALLLVVGKVKLCPWQTGANWVKSGTVEGGFTATVIWAEVTQPVEEGVNV